MSERLDKYLDEQDISAREQEIGEYIKAIDKLGAALTEARKAIASLEPDALGIGTDGNRNNWYLRDELLAQVDSALEAWNETK